MSIKKKSKRTVGNLRNEGIPPPPHDEYLMDTEEEEFRGIGNSNQKKKKKENSTQQRREKLLGCTHRHNSMTGHNRGKLKRRRKMGRPNITRMDQVKKEKKRKQMAI